MNKQHSAASVSVIVPAMNEAENLPHVFATLPDWIDEVILVDGNSTDDTIAVARRLRLTCGSSCRPGAARATRSSKASRPPRATSS